MHSNRQKMSGEYTGNGAKFELYVQFQIIFRAIKKPSLRNGTKNLRPRSLNE